MQTFIKKQFNEQFDKPFDYIFVAQAEGLYIIEIWARARGEKQIGKDATDDDDLRVEINGRKFPQVTNPQRYLDSPAAFSGGKLHNLKKTVIFLIQLSKGKHTLSFIPDETPLLEGVSVSYGGDKLSNVDLSISQQAEDGDRRPWITFVLVDLRLERLKISVKTERRFLDSDDVKILVDGETKRNTRNTFRKLWFWLGSILRGEVETNIFNMHLTRGLHYIELWADRMPTLQGISFDFGEIIKRIPNVYDPEWTGDPKFGDDSEQMILARAIYGEARDVRLSDGAKIAVGWSIRNRINLKAWGKNYHEVILKPKHYSAFREGDPNYKFVIDPLHQNNLIDKKSWIRCYEIAGEVIKGEISANLT
ncbi:MAG: cell wall hydrolase [Candidatus Portnoybacteria bacterium]|nr:cell wall hydrolase [Candidatus Portnoybacteria bacterium]